MQQYLVRIQVLSKYLTGEEIARELINVLCVTYGIRSNNLVTIRDGASINNVAMHTLKIVHTLVVDISCFSHIIDHVAIISIEVLHVISLASHQKSAISEGDCLQCSCYSSNHGPNMVHHGLHRTQGPRKKVFLPYPCSYRAPGREKTELSSKQRQEWITQINRKDWLTFKCARVYSDHSVAGM